MPTKVSEMNVTSTTETTIEALRRRPLPDLGEHESEPHRVGPTSCSSSPSRGPPGARRPRRSASVRCSDAPAPGFAAGCGVGRLRGRLGGAAGGCDGHRRGGGRGDRRRGIRHVVAFLGLDVERLLLVHHLPPTLGAAALTGFAGALPTSPSRASRRRGDGGADGVGVLVGGHLGGTARRSRLRVPHVGAPVSASCTSPRWRRSPPPRSSRTISPPTSSITRRCIWSTMPASCVAMTTVVPLGVDALEQVS